MSFGVVAILEPPRTVNTLPRVWENRPIRNQVLAHSSLNFKTLNLRPKSAHQDHPQASILALDLGFMVEIFEFRVQGETQNPMA